jgi:protocatechuate 3,4-dioxygenase beta subunit
MFKTHVALLAGVSACAIALQAFQAKSEDEKCSIEGRVVSSTTGEPLPNAGLMLAGGSPPNVVSAVTDENGGFSFLGLTDGRYRLSVGRTGYVGQLYGAGIGSATSTYLLLAPRQHLKVVYKLVPTTVVSGRVLDEKGEPVSSMAVMALQAGYQRGVRRWRRVAAVTANGKGEFRIASLAAGKYLVATVNESSTSSVAPNDQPPGDKPEPEYVPTFFPSATDAAGAVPVQVDAGTETGGIEIRLRKTDTVRIRGRVVGGPAGKPAAVLLSPAGVTDVALASLQGARRAYSREKDGAFELKGVVPGTYLLSARFVMPDQAVFVASALLQVGGRHIDGIVLQPVAAHELAGSIEVADNPEAKLNSLQIALESVEYMSLGADSAPAGPDGKFRLKDILPSRYFVQVRNLPEGSYVKSLRYGAQEVPEEGIDLTGGVSGSLQVMVSLAGARVEGAVQTEEGKPVSGATVVLAPDSRRYSLFKETQTGENGSYSLRGVAPGEYKILAWENIETGAYLDPEFLKRYEGKAEKLSLKEGDRKPVSLKVIPLQQP